MSHNDYLLKNLRKELAVLAPKSEAGDVAAHVEWAIGKALEKYLVAGYSLADLEWFKGTTFHTGNRKEMKKAA